MPHAFTEDQLVEQPAIGLFAELGWSTVSAQEETLGTAGILSRETKGEVVLVSRLRAALEKLNPTLPAEAITAAVDELTRDRSAMSLEAANREVYSFLKEGIKVSIPDKRRGGQKSERLRVIDWETPAANDFLLVSQFSVTGPLYTCRPDLVGLRSPRYCRACSRDRSLLQDNPTRTNQPDKRHVYRSHRNRELPDLSEEPNHILSCRPRFRRRKDAQAEIAELELVARQQRLRQDFASKGHCIGCTRPGRRPVRDLSLPSNPP